VNDGESGTARPVPHPPHDRLLYRLSGLLLLAWTAVVAVSLSWNVHREEEEARVIAHREANAYFVTDRAMLLWSTEHGGVYVSVKGKTVPSPYLADLPERDVTTPSGRHLTLMNPPQMIRKIEGYGSGADRVRSHLTSLRPLHPENGPDGWEHAALRRLAAGEEEVGELTRDDGIALFRLMRPLVTQPQCLKCHAAQGFQVGDIQGGIVVSLPMAPLWAIAHRHTTAIVAGHAGLWLIGMLGIGIGRRRLAREIVERRAVETHLRRRTADLRHLFDHAPVSLWREDFSAVKQRIDALRDEGVMDLRRHLIDHPEVVRECAGLVRVVAVNHAAVALHGATSQQELLAGLPRTFTKSSYEVFREELVTCALGKTEMAGEAVVQTVDGELRHVLIKVFIDPHTPEWSNAYVSIVDLTQQKETEKELRHALREKEALLREIHHRVKNNFQVIVSLLKLQSRHLDDPELKTAFQESVNRVHTMAMVHERLYGEGDLATVEGGDYLQAIVTDLKRIFGGGSRITARVDADPAPLAVDTSIPCGLIVNELVSNCFKHAFPERRTGEIRVALRRTKGDSNGSHYRLTVSDDGVGIDPALSLKDVESVGLRLVTTLTENQLGGSLELQRNHGTSFSIEFTVLPGGAPYASA